MKRTVGQLFEADPTKKRGRHGGHLRGRKGGPSRGRHGGPQEYGRKSA